MKSKAHPDHLAPNAGSAAARDALDQGRECYQRRAWLDAWRALSVADWHTRLDGADLERLAMSAYLLGRDDEYLDALDRAHGAHLSAGENLPAVRCAFWLGFRLLMRGRDRARHRLALPCAAVAGTPDSTNAPSAAICCCRSWSSSSMPADFETAYATAASAAEIGERCADADLIACARHQQGRIRLQQGQLERGLALLDEVMVAVTAGELSPLVTGLMYCSVIQACQVVYAFGRAREWTAALAQWCDEQPGMVAFTGVCRVHRAEIMQLRGAWQDAIEEAQRARESSQGFDQRATAAALYQEAEVHRLRGEFAAAEDGLPPRERVRRRPAAGAGLAMRGPGTRGRRGGRDRRGAARDHRALEAREAAARCCRDHAGSGRCGRSAPCL